MWATQAQINKDIKKTKLNYKQLSNLQVRVYICVCVCVCVYAATAAKSLQSCLTLCNPIDCSFPGSSVHGVFQARVLEWGAIAFSDEVGTSITLFIQIRNLKHRDIIVWMTNEWERTVL